MTKRKSSRKQNASPLSRLLYLLLLLLLAAVIFYLQEQGLLSTEETSDAGNSGASVNAVTEPVSEAWYDLYFTSVINTNDPKRQVGSVPEAALVKAIDEAKTSIDAALFELNSPAVTEALVKALGRGVAVRIVFDDEHALEDPDSTAQSVMDAGAEIRSDARSALMHHKFFIIDGQSVWTGSMNITRNDIYNNNNNAIFIRSAKLAANYQAFFDEMFKDGVFTRRQSRVQLPYPVLQIGDTRVETYFSPIQGDEIESRLVELIMDAQTSIRFMAFSFTLDSVGNAVIDRAASGVDVAGVFETVGSLRGQLLPMECAGLNVRQDGNPDILHHKVFIIDESIAVFGSFNFSNSGRDNNSENLLVVSDPTIAQAFLAEWQARFDEGREVPAKDRKC
jgi:phosphatidylserine/phosphatidylglycerophosphate/cardiolipin synthase-like enzyme